MIGYIVLFIIWSLLMICLGLRISDKTVDDRIEKMKRSRDFHKDQKEMFIEQARKIVKEKNNLKERKRINHVNQN